MAEPAAIKAIEASTIHQIQSGQVIVDLCSVAKELVENGLDAGATSIDVRFKNQGLDSIEVQDNGSGISPQNYEGLALKHHTSKLSTYADLNTLRTFGFRGEALSSLCALSNFSVVTCLSSEAPKGTRLEFETSGRLKGKSVVASQKGSTFTIENLFYNLPVRRRELERNVKREWGKVINLLNQYACVQTGVKFTVSQQPNKGKRIVLFSTKGNAATRENIINVFGAKTMTALIPLDLTLELESTTGVGQKRSTQASSSAEEIRIRGHVSRPAHGEGRQTPDRQMFYVNGRPCQLPQFAKVFNEVYKSYNASQSPFIFADIQLDTHLYDVNVSPDKRTILLHDQGRMLDTMRESLIELFEKQDIIVPISQFPSKKATIFKKSTPDRQATPASDRSNGEDTRSGPAKASLDENAPQEPSTSPSDSEASSRPDSGPRSRTQPKTAISSKSLARDSMAVNLISNWVERKSTARPEPVPGHLLMNPGTVKTHTWRGKALHDEQPVAEAADLIDDPTMDNPTSPTPHTPEPDVENARCQMVEVVQGTTRPRSPLFAQAYRYEVVDDEDPPVISEEPIPAIPMPSRTQAPRIPNFSLSSPVKPAEATATITIGDHTTTSIISSSPKKQRMYGSPRKPKPAANGSADDPSVPLPSFGVRLTQMFGASSSTQKASIDETGPLIDTNGSSGSSEQDQAEEDPAEEDVTEEDRAKDGDTEEEMVDVDSISMQNDVPVVSSTAEGDSGISNPSSPSDSEEHDAEYVGEEEKQSQENSKVQEMIQAMEEVAPSTEETEKRSQMFLKGGARRKDSTLQYIQRLNVNEASVKQQYQSWSRNFESLALNSGHDQPNSGLDVDDAEEKLSLIITKADFAKMDVVGQFNLGFVLAVRKSDDPQEEEIDRPKDDELFIIDQHASDEKYNFERLQANTIVQTQRLVRPKTLDLTAIEEEIIMENRDALEANGFIVNVDESGDEPVGSRCQLVSLPLSRETTFSLADLEELISLLGDRASATTVPRPSRVRKMFAMRACRSSIMVGKALSRRQMEKVVRHMGEMEKPWNCPHGRPTMRHLCSLSAWDGRGWMEGDGFDGEGPATDWTGFLDE